MALSFNANVYLRSKLAQCAAKGESDASGNPYTAESLEDAITKAGFTLEEHYYLYSDKEGTFAYTHFRFDQDYYLASKLAQLRAKNQTYTEERLVEAIHGIDLTVEEHNTGWKSAIINDFRTTGVPECAQKSPRNKTSMCPLSPWAHGFFLLTRPQI